MGVRYLLAYDSVPYGYEKIIEYENATLYENKNVYPIGFSSTNLLNYDEYNRLSYVEKLEAYQNNIIINGASSNANLEKYINPLELETTIIQQENIKYSLKDEHYILESEDNGNLLLNLDKPVIDKSLMIRFKMNNIPSCKTGDVFITINGIKNVLTCRQWKYYNANETFDYFISSNDSINELKIFFSKGKYDISNIEIYEVDNLLFDNNNITTLMVDSNANESNSIMGTIKQETDGYFMFTVPYDEGYKVYVDGHEIEFEKVNDAFIGFPITKGIHTIKLEFEAPYFNLGKGITLVSSIMVMGLVLYERKRYIFK